jgi:hypothetical protein
MTGKEPDTQQYSHIAANVAMCSIDSLRAVFGYVARLFMLRLFFSVFLPAF